jgi:pilus assembly protein CpaC
MRHRRPSSPGLPQGRRSDDTHGNGSGSGRRQFGADIFAENRQTSQVVNLLQIEGEDQVTLKVTIAEVRREVLKQLGFDNLISELRLTVAQLGATQRQQRRGPTLGGGLAALFKSSDRQIRHFDLSERAGAGEGRQDAGRADADGHFGPGGDIQFGGQVLYSTTDNDGNVTIVPYNYGINLAFKPVVLSSGRISLEIKTNVSEPAPPVSGSTPTYQRRSGETSVELPSGGSIALAGLIRDNVRRRSNGTPGVNKIPLLGTLFRQQGFRA